MAKKTQFTKVSPRLWQSSRFRELPSTEAKLLYMYLLTSPHQCSAGAYQIPTGYVCADLGWEEPMYAEARTQLMQARLISYDHEYETVYIERWFKHCPPMNDKHSSGIRRMLDELESEAIAERAFAEFEEAENARYAAKNPFEQRSAIGSNIRRIGGAI